jgi:hypothetical protein
MSSARKTQCGRVDFSPADLASIRKAKLELRGPRPGMVKRTKPVIRFAKKYEIGHSPTGSLNHSSDSADSEVDGEDGR